MRCRRLARVLALSLPLATVSTVAARIAGGGKPTSDCYSEFDGVTATTPPFTLACRDGDPCDADGAVNQSCTFSFRVCAFQSDVPACTPRTVIAFRVSKRFRDSVKTPPTPVSVPTCAAPSTVVVPVARHGARYARAVIKVTAVAAGKPRRDRDTLILRCLPAGCPLGLTDLCPQNPAGGPAMLAYTVADHGTDLDLGYSGTEHNLLWPAGTSLHFCLSGCDRSTNPVCAASGANGLATPNGPTFGPPLPLLASGVPVCVVNQFAASSVRGMANIQTGAFDSTATPILLDSIVFSTSASQVCPRCGNGAIGAVGTCDSGPNTGHACVVEGTVPVVDPAAGIDARYSVSHVCPPGADEGTRTGAVRISLPLTTNTSRLVGPRPCPGQASDDTCDDTGATCSVDCTGTPDPKGGINQWCCSNAGHTPCFPTAVDSGDPNHAIVRSGAADAPQPAWPDATYPKAADEVKMVSVFCLPSSGSSVIDAVTGSPGPGALILDGTETWLALSSCP